MNSTTPRRTPHIDILVQNIAICAATVEQIKTDPIEMNCALGFCEVAVSVPPAWFTPYERMLVATVIRDLYGDPIKFIKDLDEGIVSFYRKASATVGGKEELPTVVTRLLQLHVQEFGV
jgi:hypothetical protein